MRLLCRVLWLALALLSTVPAWSAPRFPPPEFEEGYVLPIEQHPLPRALGWQYVDALVLVAALGAATYLVHRRRSRRGLVILSLLAMLYFGFYRAGCVCAIGSIQNVARALGDSSYAVPLVVLIFFAAPLIVALFFGRTFCAAVCPHGAIQDLVLVKPVRIPRWLEQGLGVIPYVYLGAGVLFAATGGAFIICRWDPFIPIFRLTGPVHMMLLGVGFVVVAMFIGRPYCRFLCPYGVLLRLAGRVSRWRVRITPDICTQCQLCETSCPFGAIREPASALVRPETLRAERGRFLLFVSLIPVLMLAVGWLGGRFGGPAARLHPAVHLADQYVRQAMAGDDAPEVSTVQALALARADRSRDTLLASAMEVRRRYRIGGWWFGAFVGLVIGVKLAGQSLFPSRTDYEPDRGACLGCARCFLYCPQERLRLGLPVDPVPVGAAAGEPAAVGSNPVA